MLRHWIRALGLPASILLAPAAPAQDITPPKTIAFVVGVQNYDDPDLNRLQYTTKDAQDIFEQLKAVTNLDLERSRILLADPEASEELASTDPAWMVRKNKLGAQEIQDYFREFLDQINNDENVVFYFGGHGTTQAGRNLLFLPSDYSRRPQRRYLGYSSLLDDIRGSIDDRALRNVKVVFFANVCGAGTAAGDMSAEADLDSDFVKEWLANNTLGFESFALFPASAPNQNTFESPTFHRSIFANHLLEGLRGGAAEAGVITSESLFSYLDQKIDDELPKNPAAFDATIPIGVTRELEGRALYFDGLALLADAMDTDDPLYWSLAERDLESAMRFLGAGRLGAVAALRLAQVRAAMGRDPSEVVEAARVAKASLTTDDAVRSQASELLHAVDELNRQQPFHAVILTSADEAASGATNASRWKEFLESLPGHRSTIEIPLKLTEFDERLNWMKVLDALRHLEKKSPDSEEAFHLVVVYSGPAGLWNKRLVPFRPEAFEAFIEQWHPNPGTLIYDAPAGGFLKEAFDKGRFGEVSIVLGSQEPNGLTFSGLEGDISMTNLLIDMLSSGVEDFQGSRLFQEYEAETRIIKLPEMTSEQQGFYRANAWVVGTPFMARSNTKRSPIFAGSGALLQPMGRLALEGVRRFADSLVTSCALRVDPACERLGPGPIEQALDQAEPAGVETGEAVDGTEKVYDLLKQAALFDFRGDLEHVFRPYERFLEEHRGLQNLAAEDPETVPEELRRGAAESLSRLEERVAQRLEGLWGKFSRRVFLLLAPVQDYASPLVPDLVGPEGDLQAWETILRQSPIGDLVEVRRIDTSSREQFLKTLGESLAEAGPDDLIVFIFSGRGIELGRQRYLAPAGALVRFESQLSDTKWLFGFSVSNMPDLARIPEQAFESVDIGEIAGLVDIAEIADLAADRWFVGVYDTQFSNPIFEAGRTDAILDKHLNSVRPSPDQTPPVALTFRRFAEDGGSTLAKHVHMWWEGRLTERHGAPSACDADSVTEIRSPMTAALLGALHDQPHATYREWIDLAREHPCSTASDGFGFVAQGAVDLPRFASGNAAEQIPYFLGPSERRDVNLRTAQRVAELNASSGDHPLLDVSRAAILVALAEFDRAATSGDHANQSAWLEEALRLLRQLSRAELEEYGLDNDVLDLLTRALALNGDVDEARNQILEASPVQLESQTLQTRLLDLTEAELQRSPTSILGATRDRLAALEGSDISMSADVTARLAELSSAYEEPRGQYRIRSGPPIPLKREPPRP